jgi:hypothetical protein
MNEQLALTDELSVAHSTSQDQTSLNRRIVLSIITGLFAYYILIMGGHQYSIDGIVTFQAARTFVTRGSLFLDPPVRWGDTTYHTNQWGIGMSLAYVPGLIALRFIRPHLFVAAFDPSIKYDSRLLKNNLYLFSSWLNPLVVALMAGFTYLLALEVGLSRGWGVTAALALGLASPMSDYARFDFNQPLVGLVLVIALWLILRAARRQGYFYWLGVGLIIGYGILTRFDFVFVVPWLLVLAISPLTRWRGTPVRPLAGRLLPLIIPVVSAILLYLVLNVIKYGSPFNFGYRESFVWSTSGIGMLVFLISPGKGILLFFPLIWLSGLGIMELARRQKGVVIVFVGIIAVYLIVPGAFDLWSASWSAGGAWGPRHLLPMLPLATLCAIIGASRAKLFPDLVRRVVFVVLLAASWLITLNGILFDFVSFYTRFYGTIWRQGGGWAEHFTLIGSPLFAGWDFSSNLRSYDLFWLNQFSVRSWSSIALVLCLAALLIGSSLWLVKLLNIRPSPLTRLDILACKTSLLKFKPPVD